MSLSNFVSNFNRIYRPVKEWYNMINPANMTGAIDVVVIQQPDGSYLSSPFHVRFGKYGVLKAKEKIVDIEVNEVPVAIHMKLDDNGAAYFVELVDSDDEEQDIPPELATSPIPQDSPWLLMESNAPRKKRANSCSSTSSSSSSKSISRSRMELIPITRSRIIVESTVAVQTECNNNESSQMINQPQVKPVLSDEPIDVNTPVAPVPQPIKGKLNRKKRRRRSFINKHSRNSSKTSLKEMVDEHADDDDRATLGDDDDDDEDDIAADENIFVMEDEKEDTSERTLVSLDSRKNSSGSAATLRYQDELDKAPAGQTPESVSFLLSRLPDQEKLDSILEQQAELEKQDMDSSPKHVRDSLKVEINTTRHGYFSEPDLTPVTSPIGSRPPSPVLSDSELEVPQRMNASAAASVKEEQRWEWGQLPTTTTPAEQKQQERQNESNTQGSSSNQKSDKSGEKNNKEGQKAGTEGAGWGLSYLWRSKPKNEKQSGIQEEKTGIYLDDLKDDDAEMLQIYVGGHHRHRKSERTTSGSSGAPIAVPNVNIDDDAESGNGPSLPMSPHSVEGAIGGPLYEEPHRSFRNLLPDVDISLCGGLEGENPAFSTLLFEQSKVSFDDFVLHLQRADPLLFNSPDLVVRIGEQYYKWSAACPIIMSSILYGRTLPSDLVEVIRGSFQEPKKTEKLSVSTTSDVAGGQVHKKHSSSWWPFGAARKEDEGEKPESNPLNTNTLSTNANTTASITTIAKEETVVEVSKPEPEIVPTPVAPETVTRYSRGTQYEAVSDMTEMDENEVEILQEPKEKFRKTLRLSTDAINCLNLVPGMNEVQFSVTTAYQGTTRCSCHLYLWKWNDKIVISDIDGTITKSDVLGHVLPVIGRDWAQSGVAELFTKIVNNGYHIIYLSARAIGQASFTKDYLASIRQGDVNLPDGPLLLNPTSLMNALHREVIEKKPEKFKIACLNDIKSLFPDEHNPLFAGYGNRENDVIAYTAVGIPVSRIFTINYKGELRHESQTFQTSYASQSSICDHIFPPRNNGEVQLKNDCSPTTQLEFSNFAFWRDPIIDIDDDHTDKKSDKENSPSLKESSESPAK